MVGKPYVQLGQLAYETYSRNAGGKSLATGDNLPSWDNLPQKIRDAWTAAAMAVVNDVFSQPEASK